jgi:hypothetical protein
MSVRLDPTDKSKVFGQKLNDLLQAVIEFEEEDFKEQLEDLAYVEFMTPDEHTVLYEWVVSEEPELPRDLLAKCPHQFASATLLFAMIEDGER